MVITSPFKKRDHKRDSSVSTVTSTGSSTMGSLALKYEQDKQKLIQSCFSRHDENGNILESYITHVRVMEDESSPSQKPSQRSSQVGKKSRVLVLGVKKDGSVFMHKGREASNGSFQIGRTWSLNELSLIQREPTSDVGFLCKLGKDYYWETASPKERQVFVTSLVRIYRKFKNGLIPQLINWDLSLFGLDEKSYQIFVNKDLAPVSVARKSSTAHSEAEPSRSRPSVSEASISSRPSVSNRSFQSPSKLPLQKRPSVSSQSSIPTVNAPPSQMGTRMDNKRPPPLNLVDSKTPPEPKPINASRRERQSGGNMVDDALGGVAASVAATGAAAALSAVVGSSDSSHINKTSIYPAVEHPPQTFPERKDENRRSLDPREFVTSLPETQEELPKAESTVLEADIEENLENLKIREEASEERTYSPSVRTELEHSESTSQTVGQSLRGIEIVGHRRSMLEFQKEQEQEESEVSDDITELYMASDASDPALQTPNRNKGRDVLDYDVNESQDFSFDQSYENRSHDKLMTTPGTIKAIHQSDNETEAVYDQLDEGTPRLQIRKRANTVDSAVAFETSTIQQGNPETSVVDIFDNLEWDINDDADTITQKLYQELTNVRYDMIKKVVGVRDKSSDLQTYTVNAIEECDKISPLLSFFQIELAGFAENIQHVESANEGIQVETMNKKNLRDQLKNILKTVSVDENSLNVLLASDIDGDTAQLERILGDLQSAILEINGTTTKYELDDEDLGDMRALRDRRAKYENVIIRFLRKLVGDLDNRFKITFVELLKSHEFDVSLILKAFVKLLTYSTLVLFAKEVSEETFDKLIGIWEGSANSFYEQMLHSLENSFIAASSSVDKFTLSSPTAFKDRPTSADTRSKIEHQQDKLKMRLGMLESPEPEQTNAQTQVDNLTTKLIVDTFSTLQKHITLQQNFILAFFHLSHDDMSVKSFYQKFPIRERERLLSSDADEIETDRESARELYQSISSIFQPGVNTLFKSLVQTLRQDQKNTLVVILYLELFEKKFSSTNQEFLLNSFKNLSDRLKADWLRFLDAEVKNIDKTTLAPRKVKEVSIYIKNFTHLVASIEQNYRETLDLFTKDTSSITETRELVNNSYEQLSGVIIKNLSREKDNEQSVFNIQEINANKEKNNHLINLIQNCNWIVESGTVSKLPQLSKCVSTSKNIYNSSRDQYVHGLVNEYFGKIAVFVNDIQNLVDELSSKRVDPSKRNAFSKEALSKLLMNYNTKEINKSVALVRQTVVKDFDQSQGSVIQKQLIEKIWSAIQAELVSTTLSLEGIISKYYQDVELQFNKKDIIAAFNNARL